MPTHNTISGPLHELLIVRQGQDADVDELAKTLDLTRQQILNGITTLRSKGVPVVAVTRGQTYRLDTPQKTASEKRASHRRNGSGSNRKRRFTEIGPATNGRIIIQDVNGKLYSATEL
jgi:biotin operon repressor